MFRSFQYLEDEAHGTDPGSHPSSCLRADPDSGKEGFYGVGRLEVDPMTLWEAKVCEQGLPGFLERLDRLGVEHPVSANKLAFESLSVDSRTGMVDQSQLRQDLVVDFLGDLVKDIAHLVDPTSLTAAHREDRSDGFPQPIDPVASD